MARSILIPTENALTYKKVMSYGAPVLWDVTQKLNMIEALEAGIVTKHEVTHHYGLTFAMLHEVARDVQILKQRTTKKASQRIAHMRDAVNAGAIDIPRCVQRIRQESMACDLSINSQIFICAALREGVLSIDEVLVQTGLLKYQLAQLAKDPLKPHFKSERGLSLR